ncbi:hypothetical protein RND71_036552 [Anisodus tanguticus]|uniref:Uncharacterized protein n=1 Tax=Anisodus tanguticus TaxID=243964 RepID=A0AAE1R204_9SOLA|nr:hypothetical protein RND71_036552 [Anisodus tanguticus]
MLQIEKYKNINNQIGTEIVLFNGQMIKSHGFSALPLIKDPSTQNFTETNVICTYSTTYPLQSHVWNPERVGTTTYPQQFHGWNPERVGCNNPMGEIRGE